MADLTNASDQFGIRIEITRQSREGWMPVRLRLQHYVETENEFRTWVEGNVDVYESDMRSLLEHLQEFARATDELKNFEFEPQVEPSFRLSLHRIPHAEDYCRVTSLGIDLKHIIKMSIPSAYREDQINLRFHTSERRLQTFIMELVTEIEAALENQGISSRQ